MTKRHSRAVALWVSLFCLLGVIGGAAPRAKAAFDLDSGNAGSELIIPQAVPYIFGTVSTSGGDATLVLRFTTLVTNAWYDAVAPYHETAVGVYSRLPRQPKPTTNREMNIAMIYASYRVLLSLAPENEATWRAIVTSAGLDPDDASTSPTSPIGIGNAAGIAVAEGRIEDGMNQLGVADGRSYNPAPYSDYTGYAPANSPYELTDPSHWQPGIRRKGLGLYVAQTMVTPQYGFVEPYSFAKPKRFHFPVPQASNHRHREAYKAQADAVLAASANLTDAQKMTAELFDNKILSLGFSAVFAAQSQGLSLFDFVVLDFLTNMAAYDAGIVVWQEKVRHDGVRPFSAIRYLYGDTEITAWGGPGEGTVSDITGNTWRSYLPEADHPEYPSASTCFCTAHAQAARSFLGTDTLGFPNVFPAGSSRIEPGLTPAQDLTIVFPTWTSFAEDCGQSRVWAGVHFQAAVDEGLARCGQFGDLAVSYMESLLDGTAPPRDPAQSLYRRGRKGHHR